MDRLRSFVFCLMLITGTLGTVSVHSQVNSTLQRAPSIASGADKPSIFFYSDRPGSGNNVVYHMTLPKDPIVAPRQDGSGGTFNFQLYSALEFGMVLCDTQSSPNFTHVCEPDTDANIFENPDPNAPDFVGHHPGSAVFELQFYPPAGLNTCSDPNLWCAAVTITGFSFRNPTETRTNADCLRKVGQQPVNFAYLTTDGVAQSAADPLNPETAGKTAVIPGRTFQMRPGDRLRISIRDTSQGIKVVIDDVTAHSTGSMTASIANGFAQINFDPDPDPAHPQKTCSSTPYAYHPMYATSSERTRSTWLSHAGNIGFTAVIGNFEYCNAVTREGGNCVQAGPNDPFGPDSDDLHGNCFSGGFLASFGLQPIGGCFGADLDFDSISYQAKWPGTGDAFTDILFKPRPVRFTSPQFRVRGDEDGDLHGFERAAFESEAPVVESFGSPPTCNPFTGVGCGDPKAPFYPIFSTTPSEHRCEWQLGGSHIPGTIDNFGGTSASEYGGLVSALLIGEAEVGFPDGTPTPTFLDFRRIVQNPCNNEGRGEHRDRD